MKSEIVFSIRDYTDLQLALSQARRLPMLDEATEHDRTLLVTTVSELGTNILKYAEQGHISLRRVEQHDGVDIEIVAEDRGPGIDNVALALQDHYSTGSTLGLGLSAVQRMSDTLDIDSRPGVGLRVVAVKRILGKPRRLDWPSAPMPLQPVPHDAAQYDVGESVRPMRNQLDCGDLAFYLPLPGAALLAIADATGHGADAGRVAREIRSVLSARPDPSDLQECMRALHAALRLTVGAAVGLLHVNLGTGLARYAGVGNTGAMRVCGAPWHPISREGVLGQRLPGLFEQHAVLQPGDLLLMWTDGMTERGLSAVAQPIADKSASDIAHELLLKAGKPYDDAGVIVLKWQAR